MTDYRLTPFDESEMDTVIAEDLDFEGEMHFTKPLLVKGRVRGLIVSRSDVYLHQNSRVEADIQAENLWVMGSLRGKVVVQRKTELLSSARMWGSIESAELVFQSGCRFNGTCAMPEESQVQDRSEHP